MIVDEETFRKRRERESEMGEFHDPAQEEAQEEIPVPTEPADPPLGLPSGSGSGSGQALTLQDLMSIMQQNMNETKRGREENTNNFSKLERDLASTKRDVQDCRTMAAKATTLAQDTKNAMEALEKRVSILEKGEGSSSRSKSAGPFLRNAPNQGPKRDWDYLGEDEGDTAILGGFRDLASKAERRKEWDAVRGLLPPDLQAQVADVIIPNSPGPMKQALWKHGSKCLTG